LRKVYESTWFPTAVAGVGVLLRVAWYAERRPLWLDEAMIAGPIIREPLGVLVSTPLGGGQVAPIGFLALERMAVVAFGSGELALRLVPLVAAVASVFLFLGVARRTVRREAVPMAMALFAANRALVAYGAEAKQYSTDVAVALAVWLVWLVVRERGTPWRGAAAVAGIGAVAVWLSQPAILVLGGLWGAALVLGEGVERWRMSAAALGWGPSGVAAAWIAWQRVPASDRAYLKTFWADGFPRGVAWPVTAAARAFDHLLRVPPGVVWLALVLVGLWVAVGEGRRALLFGVGPVLAAYVAAGAGAYPFADRLVLFLLPVALLSIAEIRAPALVALVAIGVVAPQLVVSLLPVRHEDMRTIARAVAARRTPDEAVYVYYGAVPAFQYYDGYYGAGTDVPFDPGGCHRSDVAGYFEELDRYSARPLWLVVGHAYRGEDTVLTRYLGRDRAVRATVMADGAFARLYAPDTEPTDAVVRPLPSYADHGLECRK
jgi:hypothetical protein